MTRMALPCFTVLKPVLVTLAIVLQTARATATVLLPVDFSELVRASHAIACGRVVALMPQRTEDRRGIETLVTIEVTEYLKGNFGPDVTFRIPGGELGRYRSVTIGAPTFDEGEEVVLFLGGQAPSLPYPIGLNQGVFRVVRDSSSGERLVTPPPLMASGNRPQPVVRGDVSRRPLPFAEFRQRVRSLTVDVAEGAQQPARATTGTGALRGATR